MVACRCAIVHDLTVELVACGTSVVDSAVLDDGVRVEGVLKHRITGGGHSGVATHDLHRVVLHGLVILRVGSDFHSGHVVGQRDGAGLGVIDDDAIDLDVGTGILHADGGIDGLSTGRNGERVLGLGTIEGRVKSALVEGKRLQRGIGRQRRSVLHAHAVYAADETAGGLEQHAHLAVLGLGNQVGGQLLDIPVEGLQALVLDRDGVGLRVGGDLALRVVGDRGRIHDHAERAARIGGLVLDAQVVLGIGLGVHLEIVAEPAVGLGVTVLLVLVGAGVGVVGLSGVVGELLLELVVEGVNRVDDDRLGCSVGLLLEDVVLVGFGIDLGHIPVDRVRGLVRGVVGLEREVGGVTVNIGELEAQGFAVAGVRIVGTHEVAAFGRVLLDALEPVSDRARGRDDRSLGVGLGIVVGHAHLDTTVGVVRLVVGIGQRTGEYDRAVLEGDPILVVGGIDGLQLSGQGVGNLGAILDGDRHPTVLVLSQSLLSTVNNELHTIGDGPVRHAQLEVRGTGTGDFERDVLGFRHIGGLRDGQVVACVRVGGRPEHIHVNIVLVGEVERIVELGEVLDTGTLAAPILANRAAEPVGVVVGAGDAEYLRVAGLHRLEVRGHTGFRVLGGHDRVDERVLVVLGVLGILGHLEQDAGQLEHVVLVAGLHGGEVAVAAVLVAVLGGVLPQFTGHVEVLGLRVASVHIGVILHNDIEEVLRSLQVQAGELALLVGGKAVVQVLILGVGHVSLHGTGELRNRGVGVQAVERILAIGELLEQRGLIEQVRGREHGLLVGCIGDFGDLIEGVIHAAVFSAQHVGGGVCGLPVDNPLGEVDRGGLGGFASFSVGGVVVCLHHAGLNLVQVVERHDQAAATVRHHARGECGEETSVGGVLLGIGFLRLTDALDYSSEVCGELGLLISRGKGGALRLRGRGNPVTHEVTGEASRFAAAVRVAALVRAVLPTAVVLRALGVETGLCTELDQQTVRLKAQQILDFLLTGVLQVFVGYGDVLHALLGEVVLKVLHVVSTTVFGLRWHGDGHGFGNGLGAVGGSDGNLCGAIGLAHSRTGYDTLIGDNRFVIGSVRQRCTIGRFSVEGQVGGCRSSDIHLVERGLSQRGSVKTLVTDLDFTLRIGGVGHGIPQFHVIQHTGELATGSMGTIPADVLGGVVGHDGAGRSGVIRGSSLRLTIDVELRGLGLGIERDHHMGPRVHREDIRALA